MSSSAFNWKETGLLFERIEPLGMAGQRIVAAFCAHASGRFIEFCLQDCEYPEVPNLRKPLDLFVWKNLDQPVISMPLGFEELQEEMDDLWEGIDVHMRNSRNQVFGGAEFGEAFPVYAASVRFFYGDGSLEALCRSIENFAWAKLEVLYKFAIGRKTWIKAEMKLPVMTQVVADLDWIISRIESIDSKESWDACVRDVRDYADICDSFSVRKVYYEPA
ncbi:hypothetical protein [Pseudomonas sp. CGJS7]|uniref:hypothetical protein n=1 Tax=Pseudomonas sp. CGJS7 TaxID=3109348 RepID=UPI003008B71A